MALSYKVFPGTPYYSNTSLTTKAGEIVNTTAATYVNTTYGTVSVGGSTYYVAYGMMVSFWNSSFTGTQIDDALNKVINADTTPTANSTKMITSGGVKTALDNVEALTAIPLSDPASESVASNKYVVYQNVLYKTNAAIASGETATTFLSKLNGPYSDLLNGIIYNSNQGIVSGGIIPFYFTRVGRLVCARAVFVNASSAIAANTMTDIGTVPYLVVPSSTTYIGFSLIAEDSGTMSMPFGRGSINNQGLLRMKFSENIPKSASLFGSFFYII